MATTGSRASHSGPRTIAPGSSSTILTRSRTSTRTTTRSTPCPRTGSGTGASSWRRPPGRSCSPPSDRTPVGARSGQQVQAVSAVPAVVYDNDRSRPADVLELAGPPGDSELPRSAYLELRYGNHPQRRDRAALAQFIHVRARILL